MLLAPEAYKLILETPKLTIRVGIVENTCPCCQPCKNHSVGSEGWRSSSEIVISFSLGKIHVGSLLEFLVHVLNQFLIDSDL